MCVGAGFHRDKLNVPPFIPVSITHHLKRSHLVLHVDTVEIRNLDQRILFSCWIDRVSPRWLPWCSHFRQHLALL